MTTRQRWTLVATVIGSGTVFLDGTIVNVALPRIGVELPVSIVSVLEGQTYVVSVAFRDPLRALNDPRRRLVRPRWRGASTPSVSAALR
jgi:hypothetical protein